MSPALWAALGGAAALLLVLACTALALLLGVRRRALASSAATARAGEEIAALRGLVEQLTEQLEQTRAAAPVGGEYVITTAGEEPADDLPRSRERIVLSASLGEPLVKAAAFGYGVRKALSSESRNRIAFEMRREVKRARKARRKAARRARFADRGTTTMPGDREDAA